MNQRLLWFISVARKSPSLSVTSVREKRFIDPKIAVNDMWRALFSSLSNAFYGTMLYMTYWGTIKEWASFEGWIDKFSSTENRTSRNACTKRAKQKKFLTFLTHAQTKVPFVNHKHNIERNVVRMWAAVSLGGSFAWHAKKWLRRRLCQTVHLRRFLLNIQAIIILQKWSYKSA